MANYEFTHTINGKAVKGERFFDVFNPIDFIASKLAVMIHTSEN